ncbi:hypothetical protein LWC34_47335 [Kibdelosporangium philippinense]|uniref:Uncharacterized protein n=1 Tax=Kibdelosporangium philippinense TaxID=211113 RepID=A0ABS8ZRJ5_9PSEU|nr:hypothetical protein [Kibdelosporangium philippinense]MCE7010369.1 hypothetical protein [Kibdelosporangium philippinense]
MALLRGIGGIDLYQRHPGPLGFAKPYPLADTRQLLDGDSAPGAFSLGHDALTDLVVHISGEPRLLSAAFLQQPPCGGGLLGLQPFPQTLLPFAVTVQPRTRHPYTIGRSRDIDDATVDPEKPVYWFLLRCFGRVNAGVQDPDSVLTEQIRFTDCRLGTQLGEMPWISHHSHITQPPGCGPDRHHAHAACSTQLPGQATGVKRLARLRTEHHRGCLDL